MPNGEKDCPGYGGYADWDTVDARTDDTEDRHGNHSRFVLPPDGPNPNRPPSRCVVGRGGSPVLVLRMGLSSLGVRGETRSNPSDSRFVRLLSLLRVTTRNPDSISYQFLRVCVSILGRNGRNANLELAVLSCIAVGIARTDILYLDMQIGKLNQIVKTFLFPFWSSYW